LAQTFKILTSLKEQIKTARGREKKSRRHGCLFV